MWDFNWLLYDICLCVWKDPIKYRYCIHKGSCEQNDGPLIQLIQLRLKGLVEEQIKRSQKACAKVTTAESTAKTFAALWMFSQTSDPVFFQHHFNFLGQCTPMPQQLIELRFPDPLCFPCWPHSRSGTFWRWWRRMTSDPEGLSRGAASQWPVMVAGVLCYESWWPFNLKGLFLVERWPHSEAQWHHVFTQWGLDIMCFARAIMDPT